eukprot:gene39243-53053_t
MARPSTASATGSLSTYNTLTFDGGIGGPIVPGKLSARASVLWQHREDWISNAFTGKDDALGGFDETAARLQLLFTPTEELSALFNIHTRNLDGTSAIFRANILTPGSNKLNANYKADTVFFDGGGNNPQTYDGWGSSLKVDYDFGGATLTSITAWETTNGQSRGDIDGGNMVTGPGFIPFPSDTTDGVRDLDQFSQEVRIASVHRSGLRRPDDAAAREHLLGGVRSGELRALRRPAGDRRPALDQRREGPDRCFGADSVRAGERFGRLTLETEGLSDGPRFEMVVRNGQPWMVDTRADPDAFPELTEGAFARLVCGPRRFLPQPHVLEVQVSHPAPAYRAEYDRIFQCPVTFSAGWNALRLDPRIATWPVALQPRY